MVLKRFLVPFVLLVLYPAPLATAQVDTVLRDSINQILMEGTTPNAIWAVRILKTGDGTPVYDRNGYTSLVPASNTKLYTTAAALAQLGPDFRYRTGLYAHGPVVDGVLHGPLVVQGSGDPVIGGRFTDGDITQTFRAWADSLKNVGITRIEGDIVGDDDVFDDVPLGFSWSWDDEPFWYAAEISGLSLNDNNVDFSIDSRSAAEPGVISWVPLQTDYIRVQNATVTVHPDSQFVEGYRRDRGTNNFTLYSRIPEGRTDPESLTITNPTLFFVHVLREVLLREGISVSGLARDVDDIAVLPEYALMKRIALHESAALSEIVHIINKRSQNLYAEQILKTIGTLRRPVGASARDGIWQSRHFFAEARVDTSLLQLVDGSGLSRRNLVTADMTADLLQHMAHHPDSTMRRVFYASLPVAGVDGTLSSRMRGTAAEGNLRAKTGTLGGASALSGYVTSVAGVTYTFVIMANNYTGPSADVRRVQDRIGALLARYASSP